MKQKVQTVCIAALGTLILASCTNTRYVTAKSTFDQTVNEVKSDLAQRGFAPSGSSTDTKNNVYVEGTSYSKYSGYGSKMANDFVTTDTYRFTNDEGNTMNFSVTYKAKQNGNLIYVTDVSTAGCETSNAKQYDSLCGSGSPIKKLDKLPQDATFEEIDVMGTTLAVTGISLLAGVLLALML